MKVCAFDWRKLQTRISRLLLGSGAPTYLTAFSSASDFNLNRQYRSRLRLPASMLPALVPPPRSNYPNRFRRTTHATRELSQIWRRHWRNPASSPRAGRDDRRNSVGPVSSTQIRNCSALDHHVFDSRGPAVAHRWIPLLRLSNHHSGSIAADSRGNVLHSGRCISRPIGQGGQYLPGLGDLSRTGSYSSFLPGRSRH